MGIIIPNMIPGSNEEICRNKVFLGGKYSPNFCLSSVEEVGAGRFPVPHQTCSSGVHVCPIRGNQFKTIAKRKWFWCKVANSSCERYNTIVVDLYMVFVVDVIIIMLAIYRVTHTQAVITNLVDNDSSLLSVDTCSYIA